MCSRKSGRSGRRELNNQVSSSTRQFTSASVVTGRVDAPRFQPTVVSVARGAVEPSLSFRLAGSHLAPCMYSKTAKVKATATIVASASRARVVTICDSDMITLRGSSPC